MSGLEKGKTVAVLISIMLIIGSFSWFIWSWITPSLEKQRMEDIFRIYYCLFVFFNIFFIDLVTELHPHKPQTVEHKRAGGHRRPVQGPVRVS